MHRKSNPWLYMYFSQSSWLLGAYQQLQHLRATLCYLEFELGHNPEIMSCSEESQLVNMDFQKRKNLHNPLLEFPCRVAVLKNHNIKRNV